MWTMYIRGCQILFYFRFLDKFPMFISCDICYSIVRHRICVRWYPNRAVHIVSTSVIYNIYVHALHAQIAYITHSHTFALSDGKNIRHLTLIQLAAIYVSQLNSLEFLSYGRRRVCWWICTRACKFNWISAPNGKATHTAHNYIFG